MSLETSYFLQSNRFDNWETSSHLLNTFFSKSVLQKYCHVSTRFRRRNSVVQVKWFYLQWRWVVLFIKSSSYSQFKSLLFTRSNKGGDFRFNVSRKGILCGQCVGGVDSNISVYEGFFSLPLLFDTIICLLNNNKNTNTPILSVCATHFV